MDPLAVLLARTWCQDVEEGPVRRRAVKVLSDVRAHWRDLPGAEAYPPCSPDPTRKFIRYWFDLRNRKQLRLMADGIRRTRDPDVRRILWCAFSRMIIKKQAGVSLAMDVPHSRPHRVYDLAPRQPVDIFEPALDWILRHSPFLAKDAAATPAKIELGDARALPLKRETVDLVLTSPPYLNAIDYLRGHRMSLVWMGHALDDLTNARATSIGTEVGGDVDAVCPRVDRAFRGLGKQCESLSRRWRRVLTRYLLDMDAVMHEIARVLVPGGRAVLVMGDSMVRGTFVPNSRAIRRLGESAGLVVLGRRSRPLPEGRRYLPPPTSRKSGSRLRARMKKEVILEFQKGN